MLVDQAGRGFWRTLWRVCYVTYFLFLSWQLLTPTIAGNGNNWDKVYHFGAFAVLAGLTILAWYQTKSATIVFTLFSYGALTEILQHFIVGRSFSVLDFLANCAGVLIAIVLTHALLDRFTFLRSIVGE